MAELTRLGKYEIIDELGRGGFAAVYRALDPGLEREVALKVLDPLFLRDASWVERFRREARAIARLRHPHIVNIYELGEAEGRLFLAMELVAGPSLAQRIARQGPLPWEEALAVLADVAGALDYAHGRGVLHRDLKPANILLDPAHGAMLTDFGFARLMGESSLSLTVSGGVVGTPAYMAPEVWDGEDPLPQTDLYSLGCVAYEMLVGEALFGGKTPSAVMRRHFDGPHFPETWPAGVPAEVRELLARALARAPAGRFTGATELLAGLRAAQPASATARPPRGVAETVGDGQGARVISAPAVPVQPRMADLEGTMSNPHYGRDLREWERTGDLSRLIGSRTILVVTGCHPVAELLDRPVAERLRDEIDRRGSLAEGKRAVVVGDVWWYRDPELQRHAVVSVGGPTINALTREIESRTSHWEMAPRVYGTLVPGPQPRLALWGQGSTDTRVSAELYIGAPDGLQEFLKLCWG